MVSAITAAMAFLAFPIPFLDGSSAFRRHPGGDLAEHVIGGRYFVADVWRMPLLLVPDLGTPPGTHIGLTDSIPAAALIAKLLRGWVGTPTYVPIWILVCYLLQGPAGAIALYVLRVDRFVPLVLGGMMFVFWPVLLWRFEHAALCGQFLVLLALALHLRTLRTEAEPLHLILYLPLLVVSLLVHIYLFAMVVAILLATLLNGLWQDRIGLLQSVSWMCIYALGVSLVMWVCGYFELGPMVMKAYGQWPLDLMAPFAPGPSWVFGISVMPAGIERESFAWSGAGFALLILVVGMSWRYRLRRVLGQQFPTVLVIGASLVFAATYGIHFGSALVLGVSVDAVRHAVLAGSKSGAILRTLVAGFDLGDYVRIAAYALALAALLLAGIFRAWRQRRFRFLKFTAVLGAALVLVTATQPRAVALLISNFQSSARFVWITLYLVALLAIAGVWRALSTGAATLLLVLALGLQVADSAPFWQELRHRAQDAPPPLADEARIAPLVAAARSVTLLPSYLCVHTEPLDEPRRALLSARIVGLQELISLETRPTHSVRHSRMTAIDQPALAAACAEERRQGVSRMGVPGALTLILDGAPHEALLRQQFDGHPDCQAIGLGLICFGSSDFINPALY